MVKFGKNKLKALNKLTKKQNVPTATTNKILKKKINAEKKVSFQKEVLLKEAASGSNSLVQKLDFKDLLTSEQNKKDKKIKHDNTKVKKLKPVEKQKKRQKTQINDTKMLLSLMKKKK